MSVIKRRKTSKYLQLHNYPVQEDLDDLISIGLLTYIMSLPSDWTLYKTQLYSKFKRSQVDRGWRELAQKGYLVGCIVYVGKTKTYFYNVSDIVFTQDEYDDFVEEVLQNLEYPPKTVKIMPDNLYQITTARIEQYLQLQYNFNSRKSSVENSQLQIKDQTNKKEQKHKNKEIENKEMEKALHDTSTPINIFFK